MNTRAIKNNEQGLTLVEILATLVIIGIVFIGIMAIFPQMTLFNERTEVKLDAMNSAREEMALLKSLEIYEFGEEIGDKFSEAHPENEVVESGVESDGSVLLNYRNQKGFEVHVRIAPSKTNEGFDNSTLHKSYLKVYDENGRMLSETYGYLQIRKDAPPNEETEA